MLVSSLRFSLLLTAVYALGSFSALQAGVISLSSSSIDIDHASGFGPTSGALGPVDGTTYSNTLSGGGGSSSGFASASTYTSYDKVGINMPSGVGVVQIAEDNLALSAASLTIGINVNWATDVNGFGPPTVSWANIPSVAGYVSAGGSVAFSYNFAFNGGIVGDHLSGSFVKNTEGAFDVSFFELYPSVEGLGANVPVSLSGSMTFTALDGDIGGASSSIGFGSPVSMVPIPAAAWLFGSSLIGLFVTKRRKS